VNNLDPAIDAVVAGHTNAARVCNIGGKLVTSAAAFGRLVTDMQWQMVGAAEKAAILQVSEGFTYTWDSRSPSVVASTPRPSPSRVRSCSQRRRTESP